MIVKPRVRGFICVTAHPVGCEQHVREQINYVTEQGPIDSGAKRVLVIGASTGYGLAARITSAFACGADTLGVCFEHPGNASKPGSAGWYNTAAFERFATEDGRYAKDVVGDAFSDAVKRRVIEVIKQDLGQVDLVVYSLAAPRRTDPRTGIVYTSTLKPIGKSVTLRTIDTDKEIIKEVTLPPATASEIEHTVAVMGGGDWQMWIEALLEGGVLACGAKTTAFTYVGKKITRDIYWDGSIGAAKKMKGAGTHEGCIEQIYRLYKEALYGRSPQLDGEGRLRADDRELDEDVQQRVQDLWSQVGAENIHELTDFEGYKSDFLRLFGFGLSNVDYEADVSLEVPIPNLVQI